MSIACANRLHRDRAESFGFETKLQHHHDSVADVRRCFATEGGIDSQEEAAQLEDWAAQQRAEYEAEMGYERWLENGGPHADAIQAEQDEEDRRYGGF